MIIVSRNPLNLADIINEYPEGSTERKNLTKMSESTGKYRYDSLDQLKFELKLRNEIVNAALKLYNSNFSFATFHQSRCNPDYWERTGNGGFKLREGVKASEAINDIYTHGEKYATECATAMMIVYFYALLNIFPQSLFDEVFKDIYLMNWHYIDNLLKEVGMPRMVDDILIGDRGYFENPDVNPETPEWQGENVIVLPDGKFYGHGIGITTAENIISSLNANRYIGADQSAYFRNTLARPNFKKLYDVYNNYTKQNATLSWRPFPQPIS